MFILICGRLEGWFGFHGGGGSVLGINCGGVDVAKGGGGAVIARGVSLRSNRTPVAGRDVNRLLELSSFLEVAGGGGPSPSSAIRDMYCKQ